MKKFLLIAFLVLAAGALSANAATVNLTLQSSAGQWQLYALDSQGDNAGIFSIGGTIIGADTSGFGSFNVDLPTGNVTHDGNFHAGFPQSNSNVTAHGGGGLNFFVSQPNSVHAPGEFLYTVGQQAGTMSGQLIASLGAVNGATNGVSNDAFAARVEICDGTYSGAAPSLYLPDFAGNALVFKNETSLSSGQSGALSLATVAAPGPAPLWGSLALLALCGIAVLARRQGNRCLQAM